MGITPIINLTELPLPQAIGSDLEPPPMARVENTAKPGDETYSPSNGKSAGGSEENESEEALDELPDASESEAGAPEKEQDPTRQISFFA